MDILINNLSKNKFILKSHDKNTYIFSKIYVEKDYEKIKGYNIIDDTLIIINLEELEVKVSIDYKTMLTYEDTPVTTYYQEESISISLKRHNWQSEVLINIQKFVDSGMFKGGDKVLIWMYDNNLFNDVEIDNRIF